MPCEACGTFIACGPPGTDPCTSFADPDDTLCHEARVFVRKADGKCMARLKFTPGTLSGWTEVGSFWLRVEASEVEGQCIARVHLELECDESMQADYGDEAMA